MADVAAPLRTRATVRHRDKGMRKARRGLVVYLFLFAYAVITLVPFAWMVLTSFKEPGDVFRVPPTVSPTLLYGEEPFQNYREVLTRYSFARYLLNSLFVAGTAALGQLVTCSLAGFAFARMHFRGKNILFALVLATMLVPTEITIIPEFLLMVRLGWLDTYLPLIVPSLMIGAFGTFLLTEFFKTVPRELEDAAVIDGATPFGAYLRIFLPLAGPALASLFVIAFITNWNELLRAVLYISDSDLRTLPLGLTALQGQYESRWTLLMAGAVVSVLPMILVYLAAQKYIVRGFVSSGLK
ncbi:MAG: carbohydrate ABC transporter permease [Trueperaceae bacterium]